MADREDYIKKHTSKPYPPLKKPVPQLVKEAKEYRAVKPSGSKRSARFKIVNSEGVTYGCSYAHLIDWTYTPHTTLILTMSSRIIVIEGKNLKEIESLLMDDKLRELHEFNQDIHKHPGEKAAIIEKIDVETRV